MELLGGCGIKPLHKDRVGLTGKFHPSGAVHLLANVSGFTTPVGLEFSSIPLLILCNGIISTAVTRSTEL